MPMRTYKVFDSLEALYWVVSLGKGRVALYYWEPSALIALNGPALAASPEHDYRATKREEILLLLDAAVNQRLIKPL